MSNSNEQVTDFLLKRRSIVAKAMGSEPPSEEDLALIVRCGLRVPDHGKLTPWRIRVIAGDARLKFGKQVLLPAFLASQRDDAAPVILEDEKNRFCRAGVVLAVLSRPEEPKKVPVWEMQLSAGAVCAHLLIAAQSLGYAAQWLSEWPAFNDSVLEALGGRVGTDRIAGFIYIGKKLEDPKERDRPDYDHIVSDWS